MVERKCLIDHGSNAPCLKELGNLGELLTVGYIGLVLGLGWLSYRFVEVPAQRWLNRLLDRRQPGTEPAKETTLAAA